MGGLEVTVDTDERDVADLQVQVARAALHRVSEQLVDLHPLSLVLGRVEHATRRPCLRRPSGTFLRYPKHEAAAPRRRPRPGCIESRDDLRDRCQRYTVTAGRPASEAASTRLALLERGHAEGRRRLDGCRHEAERLEGRSWREPYDAAQDRDPDRGIGRRGGLPATATTASRSCWLPDRTRRGDLAWGLAKGGIEADESVERSRRTGGARGDGDRRRDRGVARRDALLLRVGGRPDPQDRALLPHAGDRRRPADRDDEMEDVQWFALDRVR